MNSMRLFDCMKIQAENPQSDLLAYREGDRYVKLSTNEVHRKIRALSRGLLNTGVSPRDYSVEGRDKIGIISNGRPEWLITDLAIQLNGAVTVPLFPNTNPAEIQLAYEESGIRICFVNDKANYDKLQALKDQLPDLKAVYTFDKIEGVPHWTELFAAENREADEQVQARAAQIKADDLATIIYTSGTTGRPKGVMLSHHNFVSNIQDVNEPIAAMNMQDKRALSFLPLNHVFEKMVTYMYLFNGISIYYSQNTNTIGEDMLLAKPEIFATVPRLLEKVYEKILMKGMELTGIKKRIFFWAVNVGKEFTSEPKGPVYNFKLWLARKLVFSKWQEALGGHLRGIISGGAPLQPRLARIFSAAGVAIMEGYGLTETSPVIAVNWSSDMNRCFGTVGPVIPSVQVKFATDDELLVKGPNIMMGYYKQPELTREAFTEDGWFKTGDIAEMVDGKFLKITDRKKELLKTSGGKYVAPQPIENKLKESPFIEQVMVIGEGKKFIAALIIPNFPYLKGWMDDNHIPFTGNKEAITNEQVIQKYQEVIDKYNVYFNHVEQIKKFRLLEFDWTVESGILTPKLSIKRNVVRQVFKKEIEDIYGPSVEDIAMVK